MTTYSLTRGADADIDGIFDYTAERWGFEQAISYTAGIQGVLTLLTERPRLGRPRQEFAAGLRSIRYERHSIYYRTKPYLIEVLAVVHDAQDALTIIQDRL